MLLAGPYVPGITCELHVQMSVASARADYAGGGWWMVDDKPARLSPPARNHDFWPLLTADGPGPLAVPVLSRAETFAHVAGAIHFHKSPRRRNGSLLAGGCAGRPTSSADRAAALSRASASRPEGDLSDCPRDSAMPSVAPCPGKRISVRLIYDINPAM